VATTLSTAEVLAMNFSTVVATFTGIVLAGSSVGVIRLMLSDVTVLTCPEEVVVNVSKTVSETIFVE
jgi:hypothetical protein